MNYVVWLKLLIAMYSKVHNYKSFQFIVETP